MALDERSPLIEVDFGGDGHLVAAYMLSKCLSRIFLTGPGRVVVGCIEESDARIQCVRNDRVGPFLTQCPIVHGAWFAEAHALHADL